jgi:hypothetical protein
MMKNSGVIGKGTRLQSGISHTPIQKGTPVANGLLLRGVVVATYETNNADHPNIADLKNQPLAVYCDVVVSPSIPGQRWFFMSKVLVSQKRGGLQDDDIWKPKATTMNIVTNVLDERLGSNPGQLDGDHVLIGFMNNSYDEPIILRGLPHPSRDVGNDLYPVGKRLKLKQTDGNPEFNKHHGVFRGVDSDGNHVIDSTFGHDGTLLTGGIEPLPDVTGSSGNQSRELPQDSTHAITFWNMVAPLAPVEVAKFSCTKDAFEILLTLLPCLKVEGSALNAKLTLGNGAVSATISERLEILWGQLKLWLDTHVHPTGTGPSGVSVPASPSWDSTINSGKLTFPDG